MISWLSGTIKHKNSKTITLDVNGVGYEIAMTQPVLEKIKLGDKRVASFVKQNLIIGVPVREKSLIENSEEKIFILVLDEIDQVVKKISDNFLYNLTRLNSELKAIESETSALVKLMEVKWWVVCLSRRR